MKKNAATITTEELVRRFDSGDDISEFLDWDKAERPGLIQRRVNLDLPHMDDQYPRSRGKTGRRHPAACDEAVARREDQGGTNKLTDYC